jgi:hypothetical protein
MKSVLISIILLSNVLLADTSNRYGITNTLHSNSTKNNMQEELNDKLSKKTKYTKNIQQIVDFMENFKLLSSRQRKEARQFQLYVNSHIEAIASCQNLENDFKTDMKEGISPYEQTLYQEENDECKEDLGSSTVSYAIAKSFFNEALITLEKLKTKNKIAGKRYKRLQKSLKTTNALIEFLKISSQN